MGDTLIEILVTVTILGGCAVALLITFATAITASADHRNLVTNATVLRNVEQAAYYQLALQQPKPLFTSCATTTNYASINYGAPSGYSVTMPGSTGPGSTTIPYWDAAKNTFVSSCPALNAPQLITLNVANPNGSNATTQFVVDGPGVAQTPFGVTGVSPPTAIQGSSNLLLTITGTGFVSGDTVTFPTTLITEPGPTTFVSPTTLTVFVNIAALPALSAATAYPATVTHPSGGSISGGTFTVIPVQPVKTMNVGAMSSTVGEPVKNDPDEGTKFGWDAWDTITVVSGNGAPLQGVVVTGAWTPAAAVVIKDIVTCTTDSTGTCTVYDGYPDTLHAQTPTFTVSKLALATYTYNSSANTPGSLTISTPGP